MVTLTNSASAANAMHPSVALVLVCMEVWYSRSVGARAQPLVSFVFKQLR